MAVDDTSWRRGVAHEAAKMALDAMDPDAEHSHTDIEQAAVLMEALMIFRERNAKRADLWREFGWEDSTLHIRSKAMRLGLLLNQEIDVEPVELLDDALDLINVSVFFVRNVRDPK